MKRPVSASTASPARRAGWAAITVLAAAITLLVAPYLTLDPDVFLEEQKAVYLANQGSLFLHVAGGVVALVLGPVQFVSRLRRRLPVVHRVTGRVYLTGAVAAGIGGLLLAPTSYTGVVAALGFGALAVLMLLTSVAAFVTIRRRQVNRHRTWITRSYALIFTAVTFRMWLVFVPMAGVSFEDAYMSGAWVSWVVNLLVAELVIRSRPAVAGGGAAAASA
ncbi:DUF2306 domain-containing protein [Nonomuraea sp. NPDC050643]|uniref:DUF2306 domain-containing protein n=1 Tax=Nonomuraea sp. NPDC050643 TaxID=3155660 RepID=UPI0033CD7BED